MAAASTSSDPAAANVDGPVLNVISKRVRALRKKYNRILQMEESLAQGKTLNNEQQEVLRSKPAVIALIDELEKLRSPLSSALDEEISLAISSSSKQSSSSEHENEQQSSSQEKVEKEENLDGPDHDSGIGGNDAVKDLLYLMYFGSLFDVKPQSDFTSLMLTRTHERGCCLTYDYVTDDATDLLAERDLDLISALQGLMISRPANSPVSHQDALEMCIQHAKFWLENSEQPIDPQSNVTYAGLREKLNKIMASDYFTATPQMKGPGEVAAAAAVGKFGSFQVPMHDSAVPIEGSVKQYPDTEDNAANYEEYETGEYHKGNVDEFQKDYVEVENPAEVVSAHRAHTEQEQEQEQAQAEEEHGYRNADFKEQQYIPRRGQRGGRGGGGGGRRGGYTNGRGGRGSGRGGGSYQNGRSQFYDNYYPRNNYYNKRGGRGGGNVGNPNYNYSSADQGNNAQQNMGVAS